MPRTTPTIVVTVALVLLTSACGSGEPTTGDGGGEGADGAFDGTVDGTDADEPTDDAGGAVGDTDLDAATASAVADLAAQEGVEPETVEVVTAEEVTWPDGALGCPEPDGMYTQALVPGYRIVLDLDGREVHYHGATGDTPSRCDDPQPPAETGGA